MTALVYNLYMEAHQCQAQLNRLANKYLKTTQKVTKLLAFSTCPQVVWGNKYAKARWKLHSLDCVPGPTSL